METVERVESLQTRPLSILRALTLGNRQNRQNLPARGFCRFCRLSGVGMSEFCSSATSRTGKARPRSFSCLGVGLPRAAQAQARKRPVTVEASAPLRPRPCAPAAPPASFLGLACGGRLALVSSGGIRVRCNAWLGRATTSRSGKRCALDCCDGKMLSATLLRLRLAASRFGSL